MLPRGGVATVNEVDADPSRGGSDPGDDARDKTAARRHTGVSGADRRAHLRDELRDHEPRWWRRQRERARAHRGLDLTWRVSIFLIGWAAVAVGLLGLLLPVLPGWALIFVGLAVLATEFVWAQRVLRSARARYTRLLARAADPRYRRRRRWWVAGLAASVVVLVALAVLYVVLRGVPQVGPWGAREAAIGSAVVR